MPQDHKQSEPDSFKECPYCKGHTLSNEQLTKIAEQAANRATAIMRNNFYQGIGAAVVNRFLWLMGAAAVAIILLLNPHTLFK